MSKKLKDLNEHNAQASSTQWAMTDNSPRLNGIACSKCGEEMYDRTNGDTSKYASKEECAL